MKLIVFLGNPGLKYRKTRHNVGFMMGDFLAREWGSKWKYDKKFAAEMAVIASEATQSSDNKIILAKPQLFYNLTGDSVASIMKFYKIKKTDLLVVCDDFNLGFGKIRFRASGSHGGNNGLKSISAHLGDDFARLRIGTGNDKRKVMGDTDFVLSKLSKEEQAKLPEIFNETIQKINQEFLK